MRRLLFLVTLVVLAAAVATVTYLLMRNRETKIMLQSPLAFQRVTASHPGPCANGELVSSEGSECFTVGKGFSVDRLKALEAKPPSAQTGQAGWSVELELFPEDAQTFRSLTAEASASPGRQIAMIFQGKILSAPQVTEPITAGEVSISGNFTPKYATELVKRIVG